MKTFHTAMTHAAALHLNSLQHALAQKLDVMTRVLVVAVENIKNAVESNLRKSPHFPYPHHETLQRTLTF